MPSVYHSSNECVYRNKNTDSMNMFLIFIPLSYDVHVLISKTSFRFAVSNNITLAFFEIENMYIKI